MLQYEIGIEEDYSPSLLDEEFKQSLLMLKHYEIVGSDLQNHIHNLTSKFCFYVPLLLAQISD